MDLFKKKSSTTARAWDWDVPQYTKRAKKDTQRLHKISRSKLKQELRKEEEE